ncbi:TPA: hypothetical protein ACSRSF_004907 [Enterobacter hormaechei subsp. steigerwaltii]|nr:hypothetical protein [Enterobacter kobei]
MSLKKISIKSATLGVTGTAAFIALVVAMMPLSRTSLSSEDQDTVAKIHELTTRMKADCKKMSIGDFHLDRDPPHLRDISRKLAEDCISDD